MSNYAKVIRFVGVSSTKVRSSAVIFLSVKQKSKSGPGSERPKGLRALYVCFKDRSSVSLLNLSSNGRETKSTMMKKPPFFTNHLTF